MSREITIIGGGLTGLSLAIALRDRKVPVTLHEAGSYPKHRVCGEFISGVSQSTLKNLGIAKALEDSLKHRSMSWFYGDEKFLKSTLPVPALGISRYLLDDRLQKMATDRGANIQTKSRWQGDPTDAGTVKASGRQPVKGDWIGLKTHVRDLRMSSDLEMFSGPIGYLGITPVEDGWMNVCGLFKVDRNIAAKQQALLTAYLRKNGNHTLAHRLDFAKWREGSFSAIAGFGLGVQKAQDGVLTLGDSHSIIPPFTGNGMSMALQSAESALPYLVAFANGDLEWSTVRKKISSDLNSRFRKRLTTAKLAHPFLFKKQTCSIIRHAPIAPLLSLVR